MFEILLIASALPTTLCLSELKTLEETASHIEKTYVLEEAAGRVANDLRELAAGATVSSVCSPKTDFASALTSTLRTVSEDGHFYVEETQDDEGDEWIPVWRASGYETGQGVKRVEILDGNIGYIQIESFFELEPAFPHYRAAFDMVADTKAIILDLRDNHGGSSQTTWPIQWTFLSPGSPSPMKLESRVKQLAPRAEPAILWRRYGSERPMAVLVNEDTFSAPEAVAYVLQVSGRATIIGQPSGGGAHMLDEGEDLTTDFTLYTPTSRPISTLTGENWEGSGVIPDILAPSSDAVVVAAGHLRNELEKR